MDVHPDPTDDEAAAITAAVMLAWPQPAGTPSPPAGASRWRFSGRWWNHHPRRRRRP